MPLTPKQEAFAQHYVKHGNKSDAYRHAYDTSKMADETIWVKANELSSHGKVSVRIEDLKKEFGGYKNEIEKDLQKRRDKTPTTDIYSWGQPI